MKPIYLPWKVTRLWLGVHDFTCLSEKRCQTKMSNPQNMPKTGLRFGWHLCHNWPEISAGWQVSPTKNIIPRRLGKRSDFRQWFGSGSAELRLVTGQRWGRWLFTNGPVICEKMLGKLNEAIFRDDLCWKSMGPWVFSCWFHSPSKDLMRKVCVTKI